jgi:hypothetical protein
VKYRLSRLWPVALTLALALAQVEVAHAADQYVFGSFRSPENARNWANRVGVMLNLAVDVVASPGSDGTTYRVVSPPLDDATATRVRRVADSRRLAYWRLLDVEESVRLGRPQADASAAAAPAPQAAEETDAQAPAVAVEQQPMPRVQPAPVRAPNPQEPVATAPPVRPVEATHPTRTGSVVQMLDVDVGAQARTFFQEGLDGQSRFHPSFSVKADYYRAWDDERQSFTFAPFFRYDVEDDERTHFDIREGFWSLVGDDWDLHLGVKQVFWGVTEFNHLVDIINQTDLVENIDGEDKLGQPMAHLSLVRSWGIVDFHLLTGFRERTFPGPDGRPRFFIPIDNDDATYESGAGANRVDGAVRWSHHLGAFEFGLYHFSGTSRAPLYQPVSDEDGEPLLRPHYPVIDQTGLDAQAIVGDWAFKLEAINRSGFPDRYYAFNAGFERTLVGAFGTRADLGLVMEYLYDDRGEDAFDSFFENDLALATRWHLNDLGDTTALLGVIWDHETDETILTLEASRRLGETWTLLLEGRAFTGAAALNRDNPFDPGNKGASVARDDYIELELTRYF